MSKLYGRRNGVWSPASNKGAVRYQGAWNNFGAVTPPAYEAVTFPTATPNTLDGVDGSDTYTLGLKFDIANAKLCYGARWYAPTNTPLPNGLPHRITLWDTITEVDLATKTFTPIPGVSQDILFDTPYSLSAVPTTYVISVFSWHYTHRSPTPSSGWELLSPSGNVSGYEGRLGVSGTNTYPSVVLNSWYYISPLVGT